MLMHCHGKLTRATLLRHGGLPALGGLGAAALAAPAGASALDEYES
jgi:hypothetical protein